MSEEKNISLTEGISEELMEAFPDQNGLVVETGVGEVRIGDTITAQERDFIVKEYQQNCFISEDEKGIRIAIPKHLVTKVSPN